MSVDEYRLAPLLLTHDLTLACTQCAVQLKEITYRLKPVQHQCTNDLLLCKTRGGSSWRPVSRRPTFRRPSRYVVCDFFVEGYGCTSHKNRCTFARSDEEAAVWNFEKLHRLNYDLICHLLAKSDTESDSEESEESGSNDSDILSDLFSKLDLKIACDLCSVRENEITYSVKPVRHKCRRNVVLAKSKAGDKYRPVSQRPVCRNFGPNVFYQLCYYFVEGSGCTVHGQNCTFARSHEEATVWNYIRDEDIEYDELVSLVIQAEVNSSTPQHAAKLLLQQFPGEFVEFCKHCFQCQPHKLSTKRWNETCSADQAHEWDAVLVHHSLDSSGIHTYNHIRPVPNNCELKYCSHVRETKPCWHQAGHCRSAQSQVEMEVWKAEQDGLSIRPHLLQFSQSKSTDTKQDSWFCKICLVALSSPEMFYQHCSSVEHAQRLSDDTTSEWRGRQPPHNRRAEFWLCERPQSCEIGPKCPRAHSVEELQEWMMRVREEKTLGPKTKALVSVSYSEQLLEEYRKSRTGGCVMSEHVNDVSISCDEELAVVCEQTGVTLKWNFTVETERHLVHVALLKQEPGALFSLGDPGTVACTYSSGKFFIRGDGSYDVTVWFTSTNPGLYEQWLVLDFDMRPVLLKKLTVRVAQPSLEKTEEPTVDLKVSFPHVERWHPGNRTIIPYMPRTQELEKLLNLYQPPEESFQYSYSQKISTPLTKDNYKERMHQFLYEEEQAENNVVSRLNVRGEVTTCTMTEIPPGELICTVSVPFTLTPDTAEGVVLSQSIRSALIAPTTAGDEKSQVYEASILPDRTKENQLCLLLSTKCCTDLKLKSSESYQMEVQFQLNRQRYCTLHQAVDRLPDTNRVLPDLKNSTVPVSGVIYGQLNAKQKLAAQFITGEANEQKHVAPLLIYGPFGTGKTFTLATAARELSRQPHNRVLICTHTNSSADLYIKNHFHPFSDNNDNGMRPIRVKANNQGNALFATDKITLQYCLLSKDGQRFLLPTKAVLDQHRIVVTTASMAKRFHDLELGEGYFTHILIDEASQMLECEALIALGLAGPRTRVVLAGDHMQMVPRLHSVDENQRANHTLLNRLFYHYQGQQCDAARASRVIFNENYRSTKEIVEFVSMHFYVGKNDIIKATGNVPAPADGHAIKFYHVRGTCRLDTVSMSWYNDEEVATVAQSVIEVLNNWPLTWGPKEQSSICVLSEGYQVKKIRRALSKRNLDKVHVENLANVQGKQFRVIIMTAVQTRDSLQATHVPGLELFNDTHVLNTAMTRAQSQVVVVGDAAALCCSGKCSGMWKSYLDHCFNNSSVAPQHVTKDFFEKDLMEVVRFQKSEHKDESSTLTDAILQELKDEYEPLEKLCTSEHVSLKLDSHGDSDSESTDTDTDPSRSQYIHEQQQLGSQSYNRGHGKPLHDRETGSFGQIICLFEEEDYCRQKTTVQGKYFRRLMIPLSKYKTKIIILISKEKRTLLPIWEKTYGRWNIAEYLRLDQNLMKNHAFLVEILKWKEGCLFPLGNVVDILPLRGTGEAGLAVLKAEFQLSKHLRPSYDDFVTMEEETLLRHDMITVKTFTVDEDHALVLDDAISVRDTGEHFELGVHIADVASFVRKGSKLDKDAKHHAVTFEQDDTRMHTIRTNLCIEYLSLLPKKKRRVISLLFTLDKQTLEILEDPKFKLSQIRSNKKFSYKEAEDIINSKSCGRRSNFGTRKAKDCLNLAYCFAKAQRKNRLEDWAYSQPDTKRCPGKRQAHLMIEELNVLFNIYASKYLTQVGKTMDCTPLRCQAQPNPTKIQEFQGDYGKVIPLSFQVRHRVEQNEDDLPWENFRIISEVWKDIKEAARANDIANLVDLVATDDIHPLLRPVVDGFRRCLNKAEVVCSNRFPPADLSHYCLNVPSYTQASAPMRHYLDIVVQRLLHNGICDTNVQYTHSEITSLCDKLEDNIKKVSEYNQRAEQIKHALTLTRQSVPKLAFVVNASPKENGFIVSFPVISDVFPETFFIMYKDLQLHDQPFDETSPFVTLRWKQRIYDAKTMEIYQDLQPDSGPCVELPLTQWKAIIKAIDDEDWALVMSMVSQASVQQMEHQPVLQSSEDTPETEHYLSIVLNLNPGDIFQIQMSSELRRGYQTPCVQLIHINPNFDICVDHVHNPVKCFSTPADHHAKYRYKDAMEYEQIWLPLCEMESATTAVGESDSIIIKNLVVNFKKESENRLSGSFVLPEECIEKWAIECNLSRCLLCIRKKGLMMPSGGEGLKHWTAVDPREFTWVAHAVTVCMEKMKNLSKEQHKVLFNVYHRPMETPECVLKKGQCFDVEIIPKLIPGIRAEEAVVNVKCACNLVKSIALGGMIPKSAPHPMMRIHPEGFPDLNDRQHLAVLKASENSFTLIQGPPGTGKTIVGAYLVIYLFELNSLIRWTPEDNDTNKKEVILYCGPSNKSVDVVAILLLKAKAKAKKKSPELLRVCGQQLEMLDYPCPDGGLQFSQRMLNQDRPNPELRSITLHHRMRMDQNPFSNEIIHYDKMIEEKKTLTKSELRGYKELLKKARVYELQRHDIILCTCTQSSSPSLKTTVNARQIIIDESAMATEPQTLIPLVSNKPERVILIGDHKQLRPIVKNVYVKKLGMGKSLFERYHSLLEKQTVMLNVQYRMHPEIRSFPSEEFYNNELIDGVMQPSSVLRVEGRTMPIVFGDVKGKTIRLVVSTAKGNQESKKNMKERRKVISIALKLVKNAKIEQRNIAILSPYNAQVSEIKEKMKEEGLNDITVTTFTKSQGSEWRYVIISTVCSLPSEEIPIDRDRQWMSKHLGFVGDPNQINVGITRAKEGLCIIGNQELLRCSRIWERLLQHYTACNAIVDVDKISAKRPNN